MLCQYLLISSALHFFKSMHGTLKTIEGPPNLGINLPLSSKPTNSMSPNNKESGSVNSNEKRERKPSSPTKKNSNGTDVPKKVPTSTSCPGWTCGECDRLFTQREVFIAHMKREHGKVKPNRWKHYSSANVYLKNKKIVT